MIRVLFISRKHPPSIGGMQRLSYHLVSHMRRRVRATAIIWGGSQMLLPVFLVYALFKSLWVALHRVDMISVGDPIVGLIGWVLRWLFRVPVVVTVHGLDVTYAFPPYQWLIPRLLRRMDRVICISDSVRKSCIQRGISADRCVIIRPGVTVPERLPSRSIARRRLEDLTGRNLDDATVLLTVARLVPRKGIAWFTESVLPRLASHPANVHYVIVGDGPELGRVRHAISQSRLRSRTFLLGRIPDDDLMHIYVSADLFIMPNLPVSGDMEGFGLVAFEAAAHALPVLAADLEGIRDAVIPEQTGWLLPSADADAWVHELANLFNEPNTRQIVSRRAFEVARDQFEWSQMVDAYEDLFYEVYREWHPQQ